MRPPVTQPVTAHDRAEYARNLTTRCLGTSSDELIAYLEDEGMTFTGRNGIFTAQHFDLSVEVVGSRITALRRWLGLYENGHTGHSPAQRGVEAISGCRQTAPARAVHLAGGVKRRAAHSSGAR